MPPTSKYDALEVHGMYFLYDDEEFWMWSERRQVWEALPDQPAYLTLVGGRLAVLDIMTGRPKCNCPRLAVVNTGCKCGGV